jgi:hypothetical protein
MEKTGLRSEFVLDSSWSKIELRSRDKIYIRDKSIYIQKGTVASTISVLAIMFAAIVVIAISFLQENDGYIIFIMISSCPFYYICHFVRHNIITSKIFIRYDLNEILFVPLVGKTRHLNIDSFENVTYKVRRYLFWNYLCRKITLGYKNKQYLIVSDIWSKDGAVEIVNLFNKLMDN